MQRTFIARDTHYPLHAIADWLKSGLNAMWLTTQPDTIQWSADEGTIYWCSSTAGVPLVLFHAWIQHILSTTRDTLYYDLLLGYKATTEVAGLVDIPANQQPGFSIFSVEANLLQPSCWQLLPLCESPPYGIELL